MRNCSADDSSLTSLNDSNIFAFSAANPCSAYAFAKFPAYVFVRGVLVVLSLVVVLDPVACSATVPLAASWWPWCASSYPRIWSSSMSCISAIISARDANEADRTEPLVILALFELSLLADDVLLLQLSCFFELPGHVGGVDARLVAARPVAAP